MVPGTKVIWGFPEMGVPPKLMVFVRENPTKTDDDWGYPYFMKPPYRPLLLGRVPVSRDLKSICNHKVLGVKIIIVRVYE